MPHITIASTSLCVELPFRSLLTSLEEVPDCDGLVPFGCRVGSCGACVVAIIKGGNHLYPPDDDELSFLDDLGYSPKTHRLACQSLVLGDVTIALPPAL
ncbi:MAG TPA: 2Fe-2S iron-sulfur cluster-binding protein [Candidatus Baltobacteraceae bacterium]|nr:2Fe-2S iron-sulfur cluster-binding protein [Candidatus Baltobacteraceae bacterium]